ncbi:YceI family protein [Ferruginibacter paludis]|uniref:YceI family protein n=1 Tax=Ferruginibacter paludis TaxID=1310417 RepID=UPI0025B5121A|nr:YceI family protein [Ferruginibacter paludis]MDN3656677.1 YceI family protein [Ferruginibacter paludis]
MYSTIKKISFVLLFSAISSLAVTAQNATLWKIDKAHTSVNFSIKHFFSAVTGKFTGFEGNVNFDPANLTASSVNFSIPVKSVNTDDSKRDNHLQSTDFFDAADYPNMTFTSSGFEKKSDKDYVVYGKLTIRNVSKDIALPFKITGEMEHPMMKGTIILGLASSFTINRNDYSVGSGNWASTMVVGDNVDININMELNRMK